MESGFTDAELRAIYGKLDKNRNGLGAERGLKGEQMVKGWYRMVDL